MKLHNTFVARFVTECLWIYIKNFVSDVSLGHLIGAIAL